MDMGFKGGDAPPVDLLEETEELYRNRPIVAALVRSGDIWGA
ncbi:hypothetical protein U716_15060 [Rhodobacter capsulatus B6]|nr:hypothetical protein U716_15060 [Rhodobacter capsulatus B6]